MGQLVEACRANDITDLIIVHEHRGEPGSGEKGFGDRKEGKERYTVHVERGGGRGGREKGELFSTIPKLLLPTPEVN